MEASSSAFQQSSSSLDRNIAFRKRNLRPSSSLLYMKAPPLVSWTQAMGESALKHVQNLASRVAESNAAGMSDMNGPIIRTTTLEKDTTNNVKGIGGPVMTTEVTKTTPTPLQPPTLREQQVWTALANLERDSKYE
jgi:hypothetical protein